MREMCGWINRVAVTLKTSWSKMVRTIADLTSRSCITLLIVSITERWFGVVVGIVVSATTTPSPTIISTMTPERIAAPIKIG